MPKTFNVGDKVVIGNTQIVGEVIGKTEYAAHTGYQPNHCVRFDHPETGLPTDEWYVAHQLSAPSAAPDDGL